jgi:uncharacterized protein YdeI (YjbR/CyaY-like superfamily)
MSEQTAQALSDAEERIDRQIREIYELEDAGLWSDAVRAREALAVFTETRDALRLRLKVATQVAATQTRFRP